MVDQQGRDHAEKSHQRPTPTKTNDKTLSPSNSLVQLELQTSSFFDTARLRENKPSINKDQQRRHRSSAVPESTRYYSSNNAKTNPSTSSRPAHRRPLSLSLENQHSPSPIDYHFASTSEPSSEAPLSSSTAPTFTRRARRTVSPSANRTHSAYVTNEQWNPSQASYRHRLSTSPESSRKGTSTSSPSRYVVSYDFDPTLRDTKRKPVYKYASAMVPAATDLNVVPNLSSSTTPVAPSVFTTSAIKFAPAPARRTSPFKDTETKLNPTLISTARLFNSAPTNPPPNTDDSINKAAATPPSSSTTNNHRPLLTSLESPIKLPNNRKSRLLDDNNNLISLKVHD